MKKNLLNLAVTLLAAFALASAAKATPINGAISFTGGVVLDNASIPLATEVSSWTNAKVQNSSGDLGVVAAGSGVTFATPWVFSGSGPVLAFWQVGGFTFDLASWNIVVQGPVPANGPDWLVIYGSGSVSGNGYTATEGTWSFTTQSPSIDGVFSFSASSSVPDGGTTALLVGLGLVGMSFIARRRK